MPRTPKAETPDEPKGKLPDGPNSGVLAPGAVGKAARAAAAAASVPPLTGWRDPKATFSDDDDSPDAKLWRLRRDQRRMSEGR